MDASVNRSHFFLSPPLRGHALLHQAGKHGLLWQPPHLLQHSQPTHLSPKDQW